ncbi:hypothetical protein LCGC14_2472350 [marine sediment metagenome]|uniref:Uncharacterized protein n=1 Tax=marine sediment metagenome TaxID=412755 RepID=A0A0F9DM41_9ZZZZ
MVQLAVNLTPLLTGVQGTLYLISGETVYPLYDLPPSIDGFISFGISVSDPMADFAIIFPEQTIEGVTYGETASTFFNLVTNALVNVILTPKADIPPPPEVPPMTGLGLGLLVAVVAGVFIFGKKKK